MHWGNSPTARRLRPRAGIGDVLLACVRDGDGDIDLDAVRRAVARADLGELVQAARYHRVVGFVHDALRRVGTDGDAFRAVQALHHEATLARFATVRRLREVREVLDAANLQWVTFKGPVLSEVVYRRPGVRLYHDLDVLVRPGDFASALTAFEDAGFRIMDPNWGFHQRWMAAELRLTSGSGADVDLHWHLLISRQIRRFFRIPVDELVDRGRAVVVQGMRVTTFDAADTLLHLAIHAALEGGDRLVWLKDIEQAITREPIEWNIVVERSRSWRVEMLVGTMLSRVRATLGAPVPDEVVRDLLRRRVWRVAIGLADRLAPPQTSSGRGTIATHLARNARVDLASSAASTGSEAVRVLRGLRNRERWRRARWNLDSSQENDPRDPRSKLYPSGGEEERARFLREIAREAATPYSR